MRPHGGGSDEGDQLQAVLPAGSGELLFLLKGHVGKDQAAHPHLCRPGQEPVHAIGEYHVGVGHEYHGNGHVPAQVLHQLEQLAGGDAAVQGPEVGPLDDKALGGGGGEGDAQLDEAGPVFDALLL